MDMRHQDYGLDAVMGELSWRPSWPWLCLTTAECFSHWQSCSCMLERHIDVFFQGYVLLERYVALGKLGTSIPEPGR